MFDIDKKRMASEIRDIFQIQQDRMVQAEKRHIMVSHFGVFSQDLVNSLSTGVEELLISIGDKRMVIKRMFTILIEGLQNIRLHGDQDQEFGQLGYLIIAGHENNYKIIMANLIQNEEDRKVEDYLEKINRYTDSELKEVYLDILSNEFLSQKGGAGLGLITTRMKSGNPLGFEFYEIGSTKKLFIIEVILNR